MKKLILNIAIAFVSMTTVCNAANNLQFIQINNPIQNEIAASSEKGVLKKPVINEEAEAFNPETVIPYQVASIHQIIIQNDKITENKSSDDIDFINYEATMKATIAQLDLITENTSSDEIRPLDFKKIDTNTINNVFTSKTFVGMN